MTLDIAKLKSKMPNKEDMTTFFKENLGIVDFDYSQNYNFNNKVVNIRIFLERKKNKEGKKEFNFSIFEDGKKIYENDAKNNLSLSLKSYFKVLKEVPAIKNGKNQKDDKNKVITTIAKNLAKDFGQFFGDDVNINGLYAETKSITEEESDNYFTKIVSKADEETLAELEKEYNVDTLHEKEKLDSEILSKNLQLKNSVLSIEEKNKIKKEQAELIEKIKKINKELELSENSRQSNFSSLSLEKIEELYKDSKAITELEKKVNDSDDSLVSNPKWAKYKITELKAMKELFNRFKLNSSKYNQVPDTLFDIATKDRGRISKLEKVIVNHGRELIISMHLNNIDFKKDWIEEFKKRTFGRIDEESDLILVTEKDAELAGVPLKKNIYNLIKLEIKGKATKTMRFELETLKKTLGFNDAEMISYIYFQVLESVYFYRPDLQEKNVEFDTYILSAIKKAIQDLQNHSIKVDKFGGIKERQKDDLIKAKLKKYKYELEIENKDYNLENLLIKANQHNTDKKTFKISENDIKQFMNNLETNYLSLDETVDTEDGEMGNEAFNNELWEKEGAGSEYDTSYVVNNKIVGEAVSKRLREVGSSVIETIIIELWLDKFGELEKDASTVKEKNALNINSQEFNEKYRPYNNGEDLPYDELKEYIEKLKIKLFQDRNTFRMMISENL